MKTLRDQIRQAMTAQGLTQRELAEKAGISERTLAGYLNGETAIGIDKLERISAALDTALVIIN